MLIDWLPNDGGDGMTVDVDGDLYIAVRDEAAPGVHIYTPQINPRAVAGGEPSRAISQTDHRSRMC